MEKRRLIINAGQGLLLLSTEPEGQDIWLRPGQTFEVRAQVESAADDFVIVADGDAVAVWPSAGMGYISAWLSGEELPCGYQHPS